MRYPLPNLVLLRQFVAVAEHQSISDAARSLNITQPALSKNLRKLEQSVGTALVERFASGVRLTPAGETFLAHARAIGLEYEHALQSIRNVINDQETTINLYSGPIWSSIVLPTILGRFHRLFPNIRLNVQSTGGRGMSEALEQGRIEIFAGALLDTEMSDSITVRKVAQADLAVLADKAHPLARLDRVAPGDLAKYPFTVFSPSAEIFHTLNDFLHRNAAPLPRVVLETTSLQSCVEVTRQENFLFFETTMIPKSKIGEGLVSLDLGEVLHTFDIGLAYRNGLERIPHYARLMGIMADAMSEFSNEEPQVPAS